MHIYSSTKKVQLLLSKTPAAVTEAKCRTFIIIGARLRSDGHKCLAYSTLPATSLFQTDPTLSRCHYLSLAATPCWVLSDVVNHVGANVQLKYRWIATQCVISVVRCRCWEICVAFDLHDCTQDNLLQPQQQKVKGTIQLFIGNISQSYRASPAIWDQSVTCYLTHLNTPCLNPS